MISCHDLSLINGSEIIIKDLTLELPNGQISALYGPTGSGKTVLLLIFAGLVKPNSGEVSIDGLNVIQKSKSARKHVGLGVIPGFSPLISKLTLEENLLLVARALRVKNPQARLQKLLRWLQIESQAQTLAEDLPPLVAAKANLALALLNNPVTLLLDEPEYRLTSEETKKFWFFLQELKAQGKCIVISTRHQEVAAQCDKTLFMGKGVDDYETAAMDWHGTEAAFT